MNFQELIQPVNDDVSAYFRSLGFRVDWDFNASTGHRWYEIFEDSELLIQIDFGAPLADLISDLPLLADGLPSTCSSSWVVCDEGNGLRRVVDRMRALS